VRRYSYLLSSAISSGRFLHLAAGQFMRYSLCAGLRFLPVVIAVTDKVRRRGVAQFLGKIPGQHLSLADVGEITRFVAGRVVIHLRRHITFLLLDAGEEALACARWSPAC
jgi:hypothetical protein